MPILRRLSFSLGLLVLAYCAFEALALAVFLVGEGQLFTFRSLRTGQLAALQPDTSAGVAQAGAGYEILHPYLGFVIDHQPDYQQALQQCCGVTANDLGFLDKGDTLRDVDSNQSVVGVFGGSVAFWLSVRAPDVLAEHLGTVPPFRGREISVVRVALGGYKQPQQLQALSYLLAIGARFDAVINIDGFNEVTLAPTEMLSRGVFPFFPRNWATLVDPTPKRDVLLSLARRTGLQDRRRRAASLILKVPFRYNAFLNVAWLHYDRWLAGLVSAVELELQQTKGNEARFVTTGPTWSYPSGPELYERLANVWMTSSLQMHKLASANGILYFHVLQPNQYLPGSKTLTPDERRYAYRETQPYRQGVLEGYPRLIEAGRELVAEGVRFVDMTQLFRNVSETVYEDDCCHLTVHGNRIFAAELGRMVAQQLRDRAPGSR